MKSITCLKQRQLLDYIHSKFNAVFALFSFNSRSQEIVISSSKAIKGGNFLGNSGLHTSVVFLRFAEF